MPSKPALVWFREDLRLSDHTAVAAAVTGGRPVIPVYVLDETPSRRLLGGASRWWLDKSLRALAGSLERRGSRLILRRGEAVPLILALAQQVGAAAIHWSRGVQASARAQDDSLAAALAERGIEAHAALTHLLHDPLAFRTGAGTGYRVYGAFQKALRPTLGRDAPLPAPERLAAPRVWPDSDDLDAWRLHPTHPDWSTGFTDWTPGEAGARARLDAFIDDHLAAYQRARDTPGIEGTTRLSPHLRFGEISPRQVLHAANAAANASTELEAAHDKLVSEVLWREFSHHLLAHNPDIATRALRPAFEAFPFRRAPKELHAWARGRTGYPIVDAGMRQLWETGWMHNRVRLIVASFLVKHLLLDWREGERWFWDTLVDADPGNNPASWQWIAGAGVDSAPYFRIFNPVLQGERFDPDGAYVRRWVPELARLPAKALHAPWAAPVDVLTASGVRLGEEYPRPIVDHGKARERALGALKTLRNA